MRWDPLAESGAALEPLLAHVRAVMRSRGVEGAADGGGFDNDIRPSWETAGPNC